jgi:hypothetical protein
MYEKKNPTSSGGGRWSGYCQSVERRDFGAMKQLQRVSYIRSLDAIGVG